MTTTLSAILRDTKILEDFRERYSSQDFEKGDLIQLFINYMAPDVVDVRQGMVLDEGYIRNGSLVLKLSVEKAGRIDGEEIDFEQGPYTAHTRKRKHTFPYTGSFQYQNIVFAKKRKGRIWVPIEPTSTYS